MISADKLLGSEVIHGDERERTVFTTGGTIGMLCGFYLCIFTALAFAVFGHILVPFVLVLLGGIPSIITVTYSEKRGVDAFDILARGSRRSSRTWGLGTTVILLLLSAAMIYTTATGAGLLEFDISNTWLERFDSMGNGAAIGAGIGAVGGYLWSVWLVRRRRKQQQSGLCEPDED